MVHDTFIDQLLDGARRMGLSLEGDAAERLWAYYVELERFNRRINLVSRRPADWVMAHFLDSLAPLALGLVGADARVADLGAGAGFPGLALKAVRTDVQLVMVESSGKKSAFLRHVVRTLGLEGASVEEGRFDQVIDRGLQGRFDLVVSRAAAKPDRIAAAAGPFLAPEGRLLVYTTLALVPEGVGRARPYRVPGSKVPSVLWEVERSEIA